LSKMTRQYVANSSQSAVAAESLSGQAEAMQDLVSTFQLSSSEIRNDADAQPTPESIPIDQKKLEAAIQWDS